MSDKSIPIAKESWKDETRIYHSRFENISTVSPKVAETIKNNYPGKYFIREKEEKASDSSIIII